MAASGSDRLLRFASGPGWFVCCPLLLTGPHEGAGRLRGNPVQGLGGVAWTCRSLSLLARSSSEDKVTIHFINRDGGTLTTKGKVGDSLLDVVVENNLNIDGFGVCEGTLVCFICHLIFEEHIYEKLDTVTDEEKDVLAYGLRSQLGCQICLTKSMDIMTVGVPKGGADARQAIEVGKNSLLTVARIPKLG